MNPKEDPRTFSALVRAIDEKYSHTYEDFSEPEEPSQDLAERQLQKEKEMREYFDRLLDQEGYNDKEKFE